MRVPFLILACLIAAAPARADCAHFKWSVETERQAFASATPMPAEGGTAEVGKAYALTLSKDVKLPLEPERPPRKDAFAGFVNVPKLEAGLYQVTLSGEAWIDVAQNGARVKSRGFTGQRDCPGVRKSVRFPLGPGPAVIQISNASAPQIIFAISPAK